MNLIYDDHMIIRYGQHHMTIYDGHPKMKQSVEKNICKITFENLFRILFGKSCFDCLDSKSFLKHIVESLKIYRQIFQKMKLLKLRERFLSFCKSSQIKRDLFNLLETWKHRFRFSCKNVFEHIF